MRYKCIVDTDTKTIIVEYPEVVVEYDLHMYEAALNNPKYWEEAEIRILDSLPAITQ